MAIPLGAVNFNVATFDFEQLATAIQNFIEFGSKKGHILINELCIVSDADPIPEAFDDVADAIQNGTKFFDACLYLSLPSDQRPAIRAIADNERPTTKEYGQIGEAIFVIYFYLLTRARVPARTGEDANHPVPRFLTNVLSLTRGIPYYLSLIAGFDIAKMDHKWIKAINMSTLGDEFRNRAGLGVAGYRMLGPFKAYTPKANISAGLTAAINVAKQIATAPPDWNVHPLTRNPTLLSNLGNLNKNLGNLILDVFTDEQIREMIASKMIFAKPTREPTHIQYRTWTTQQLITFNDPVFRVQT